jgi:membrane associated rhomboid family serine protease
VNQTRLGSLIEALFGVVIGLAVSIVANAVVFPRFGFHPSVGENVSISAIYTAISLTRQYVLRRWFNARLQKAAQRLARSAA